MPIVRNWDLDLDADKVLRGQLADPSIVRSRSPRLLKAAQAAIESSQHLLEPAVLYRRVPVAAFRHQQLHLAGGGVLSGSLIADQIADASEVIVAVCTVGAPVSQAVAALYVRNPVHAMSLEGLANAATHELGAAAYKRFVNLVRTDGLKASIALYPGMIGWPLEEGQTQISNLIDLGMIGVSLNTDTYTMSPIKSLSFVVGLGKNIINSGVSCDFCSTRASCRYQERC